MSEVFRAENAIGEGLLRMDRQELCRFVIGLCQHLNAETGPRNWRGGIYPENISVDEEGHYAIGPAKTEGWSEKELAFVAPELYWHGETSPAADVWSLGLLLYYGLGGGRLPFDTATSGGQLARISGKKLPVPKGAGKRLAQVMELATAFQAEERIHDPEALRIMLESCLDNKYLADPADASTLFHKEDGELSDLEKMMVDIILREGEEETDEEAEDAPETAPEEAVSPEGSCPEEIAGLERPAPVPEQKESVAEMVEEFFGSLSGEPTAGGETEEETPVTEAPPVPDDEPEDVRVYEPCHEKKDRLPIPILTEEKDPELAPVVLPQTPRFARNISDPVQQQKVVEEVRKRRGIRPLAMVGIFCVLLIVGAFIAKAFLDQEAKSRQIAANAGNPTPDPAGLTQQEDVSVTPLDPTSEGGPLVVDLPTEAPELPRYEVKTSDMGWTAASITCREQGGHLAVISSEEEFREIVALAEAQGLTRVWIGCHREDDRLVWETEDEVHFTRWADGEPSYWDGWDGVPEDYVMIYKVDGDWYYNDNRDDPAADYPEYYRGTMGYVCEFER